MRHTARILFTLLTMLAGTLNATGKDDTYYILNGEQGLAGNNVLQMLQLEDGRMVFVTESHVNVYDGIQFNTLPLSKSHQSRLDGYKGYTHLYVDTEYRLWIKDYKRTACLDLKSMSYVENCKKLFNDQEAEDFFITSDGCLWTVRGRNVSHNDSHLTLRLPNDSPLQDMDGDDVHIFLFTADGTVNVYDNSNGRLTASLPAYSADKATLYDKTSLIRKMPNGEFYQIRMGSRSVLLSFNPRTLRWREVLECDYPLHTLTVAQGGLAYITTGKGFITLDTNTGQTNHAQTLRLPDGTRITTGINTVCCDREGSIWLGTYSQGVLYTSPQSGIFATEERPVRLKPVLTKVLANGRRLTPGSRQMAEDAPFAGTLNLEHSENTLMLTFSTMKFVRPRNVVYRYRLKETDADWHTVDADSNGGMVDDHGVLTLTFADMPSGSYTLEVAAAPHGGAWTGNLCRLTINIERPWWLGGAAFTVYLTILTLAFAVGTRLYTAATRRKQEQKNHEQMLLMRIQELIEKSNQYESSMNVVLTDKADESGKPDMSEAERDFLRRATDMVEQHLTDPSYTVEQLGRDLCMERTGLYRKLMAIMDKSPQSFIRSIRLEKAAAMLAEGNVTVAEVAEATGFSSSNYFSKCFQKEFGHKPSEHRSS